MIIKKAFDTVNHYNLWIKLLNANISGNVFTVIRNMYMHAKSFVRVGNCKSKDFLCKIGVRQGDNLSPLLFAIFINDFSDHISKHYKGLTHFKNTCTNLLSDDDVEVFIKLYCLLYADDTLLLAETKEDLQDALNATMTYCKNWDLQINEKKTKVMVFSRGRIRKIPQFVLDGENLDVVNEFTYLGIIFTNNGSFKKTIANNVTKAKRAMFKLLNNAKKLDLNAETQIELFDRTVSPILLYGAEV